MDTGQLIERIAKTGQWVLDDADWRIVDDVFRAIHEAHATGDTDGVRTALAALEPLERKQPRRVTHTLGPGVHPIGDELDERRSLLIAEVGTDPDGPGEPPARETTR
ncbi:CATRA system-associated protein [Streptomyces sp. NPDC059166]|uniref:CATRA system-associated protein n=1 Tax=Streptomyces sp. NPDC059166 TaxID=3346752 RepID=UPI0036856E0E